MPEPADALVSLSRRVRTWQVATAAALGIATLSLALAATLALRDRSEFRARSFVVVDGAGEEVARLADERGGPRLTLRARDASVDVVLGSFASDAMLAFIAGDQIPIGLGIGRDGFPGLSLADAKGQRRLLAGLTADGDPAVVLWGAGLRERLVVRPDRGAAVQVFDAEGAPVVSVPPAPAAPGAR